ncbi:MAG TPA: BsuPI-related putative proteinase inhibitor [bacterium]|jgi:hypothetical protein|nr:BsuPI-related putative proteinase inhibitor [bacterium]
MRFSGFAWVIIGALMAALASAGCRAPTPAAAPLPAPATETSAQSGDLVLRLTVSSADVEAGSPMVVSLLLRNTGTADAVLRSVSAVLFDFAVYDALGRPVIRPSMSQRRLLARQAVRVLRPGESTAASMVWQVSPQAAAGQYLVEGYAVWTAPGSALLTTPRLAVTVRKAQR